MHQLTGPRTGPLTRRENEVVDMLIQGYNNLAIALNLGVQEHTIKVHIYNICGKLKVNSRLDLAVSILKERHAKELSLLQRKGHSA